MLNKYNSFALTQCSNFASIRTIVSSINAHYICKSCHKWTVNHPLMFCTAAKIVVVDSREGSTYVPVIDISSLFVIEMFSNENETLTLKRKQTDGIGFL